MAECLLAQNKGARLFHIRVDQNENSIRSFGRDTAQGKHRRVLWAEASQGRAIKKARMFGQQFVQLSQFRNEVVIATPGHATIGMNINPFAGQPFDTAGKAETTTETRQGAELVSEQRPLAAFSGQAF